MAKNPLPFDEKDISRVLGTTEGQQILNLLNRDGGKALRSAVEAYQNGDIEGAKRTLSPIVNTREINDWVNKLNKKP